MTKNLYIALVISVFLLACGISAPLAIPTNTDTTPTANTEKVIDTLTPVSQNVTSTPEVTCFGIVQVDRLNLRERPSYYAPADGQGLKLGQVVTIIDTFSDWYFVETSDGRSGWARAEYVKPCNP